MTGQESLGSLRVVMPVHNAGPFLRPALESVLDDLAPDDEVVVVDDGSTDGSGASLRALLADEPRARVLTLPEPTGVSNALNRGITEPGCPELVAVAEHDDVVLRGRFAAQRAALLADDRLGAVSSTGEYLGPSGRVFGRVSAGPRSVEEFDRVVATGREILVPHPAVMYRRDVLLAAGLYDPAFDGAQDLELMNRIAYDARRALVCLPGPHFRYRLHDSATSFARLADQRLMTRYVRYRNTCTLEGSPAESYAAWRLSHRPGVRTRWRWARHDRGAEAFRRAGLAWLERRYGALARLLLLSLLLHPQWVGQKVLKQLGRR